MVGACHDGICASIPTWHKICREGGAKKQMCRRYYNKIERLTIQIVKLQNPHYCVYCGRELKHSEITVDHVIPFSKGGKTDFQNLVIACKHCNQVKSNKTLYEFIQLLN